MNLQLMPRFSADEIKQYFERIHYTGSQEPTKATLDALILHHLYHMPFETLEGHDEHHEISLDPDDLFHKLIIRKRGGYCLELNGSFYRLLISLGFDARPCLCRVLMGTEEYTHPIDHRGTLITIDGHVFFTDVGLGGPMSPTALDIDSEQWVGDESEAFCIKKDVPGWYALYRKTAKGTSIHYKNSDTEKIVLMFTTITCYETDFLFINHYMSSHPAALHVAHRIVNMRTPHGYRAIQDNVYKELCDGMVHTKTIEGMSDLKKILKDKFNISF